MDPAPWGLEPGHFCPLTETPMRNSSPSSRPANPRRFAVLAERAHSMRRAPTTSEALFFQAVRAGRLGVSFRRQVPLLGRFIVDLFASEIGLVVEIDGGYHVARVDADARRDRALARAGYHVVRVPAEK